MKTTTIANQITQILARRGPLTRGTLKRVIGPPDNRLVTATLADLTRRGWLVQEGKRFALAHPVPQQTQPRTRQSIQDQMIHANLMDRLRNR